MKNQVIQNFSKAAPQYEKYALFPKKAAQTLLRMLEKERFSSGNILEIGCGTGYITEGLTRNFPLINLYITDISSEMVKICRFKYENSHSRIRFLVQDGEAAMEADYYTMIVSGLTLQWFQHYSGVIASWYHALKHSGVLLFSWLTDQSFPEWKEVAKTLNIPFTGNVLPGFQDIRRVANTFSDQVELWEERIVLSYGSAQEFFHHLKGLGADTNLNGKRLQVTEMRKLLQYWNENYSPLEVTYCVGFGRICKQSL